MVGLVDGVEVVGLVVGPVVVGEREGDFVGFCVGAEKVGE